jgi:hypothetical protein
MAHAAPPAEAVAAAVADMQAVRRAFADAGLLDATPPLAAAALAGGAVAAASLRRDLLLADALLRNRVPARRDRLRHVVVFGGTKVGKSSVINLLARARLAPVSPEGGFTRFPWAFPAAGIDPLAGHAAAFAGFVPRAADDRAADDGAADDGAAADAEQYRVVARAAGDALPRDIVLWDTPDCDSVGAEHFLPGLIEALSLADLVVYVTSVEKYAVAALVEWVFDLHDAGLPLLECLNKTPARDRAAVLRKQQEDIFPRLAAERGGMVPSLPVLALRVMSEGAESDLWNPVLHPEADALRAEVLRRAAAADAAAARPAAAREVGRRAGRVLAVLRDARAARGTWDAAVAAAVGAFVQRYHEQYLAAGEVIEPFTRLNLEIMRLLDYDNRALNAALQMVRRATSLPARLLIQGGRRIHDALMAGDGGGRAAAAMPPQARAFAGAHADLLNTLGRVIDAARAGGGHHPFWDRLDREWQVALPGLHAAFGTALAAQLRDTEAEIGAAAARIVAELRKRPAFVTTLKGVRIATQAGAVAVGFLVPHGGGLVHDALEELVITPLLLGATEKSADWLVGAFVEARRRELVARLRQEAQAMADTVYAAPLAALAATTGMPDLDAAVADRLADNLATIAATLAEEVG